MYQLIVKMDRATTVHPNDGPKTFREMPVYPPNGNYEANALFIYFLRKHIGLSNGYKPGYTMAWADTLKERYHAYVVGAKPCPR